MWQLSEAVQCTAMSLFSRHTDDWTVSIALPKHVAGEAGALLLMNMACDGALLPMTILDWLNCA